MKTYLVGFISGLYASPEGAKTIVPFGASAVLSYKEMRDEGVKRVRDGLDWVAKAAAAMTSRSLSRTTGEVLGLVKRSWIVSRNLRLADWMTKTSEQL